MERSLKKGVLSFLDTLTMAIAGSAPAYSITVTTSALVAAAGVAGPAALWIALVGKRPLKKQHTSYAGRNVARARVLAGHPRPFLTPLGWGAARVANPGNDENQVAKPVPKEAPALRNMLPLADDQMGLPPPLAFSTLSRRLLMRPII